MIVLVFETYTVFSCPMILVFVYFVVVVVVVVVVDIVGVVHGNSYGLFVYVVFTISFIGFSFFCSYKI